MLNKCLQQKFIFKYPQYETVSGIFFIGQRIFEAKLTHKSYSLIFVVLILFILTKAIEVLSQSFSFYDF